MSKKLAKVMKLIFIMTMVVSFCCFTACGGDEEKTPDTYTVTIAVNNADYGSVNKASVADVAKDTAITVDGNKLTIGTTEITATAAQEDAQYIYAFVDWTATPSTVTEDITITANFSATAKKYTVTIAVNNADYGSVSETSVADVAKDTAIAVDGNKLTIGTTEITATAAQEDAQYIYAFVDWTATPSTVTEDITITANFSATVKKYTVTFDMDGGTLSNGEQTDITSLSLDYNTPASDLDDYEKTKDGYAFVKWQYYTGTEYVDLPEDATVQGEITLKAVWVQLFTVTVENGTGSGVYADGEEITITANENQTKTFVKWTSDNVDVSTDNPYTFNVTENITLTAEFENAPVTITTGTAFENGWDINPVENWKNSGYALSFDYKNNTGETFTSFYFQGFGVNGNISTQIAIDLENNTANNCVIEALGDGWYRVLVNYKNMVKADGCDGSETLTKIYFAGIAGNSLSLNNLNTMAEAHNQSFAKQLTAGCTYTNVDSDLQNWNLVNVENWKTSGKALSFNYKNVDGTTISITLQDANGTQRARQIAVSVNNNTVSFTGTGSGFVKELGDGWYNVVINYCDLGVYDNNGSNGSETLAKMYFSGVGNTIIYINDIDTVAEEQFAPVKLNAGATLSSGWNIKPVESWKTSGKALSFDYKDVSGNGFIITGYNDSAAITRQISINNNHTVSFFNDDGSETKQAVVSDLGDGWYHVVINYSDLGVSSGNPANGEATLVKLYCTGVGTNEIYINNVNTLADAIA